MKYQIAIYRSEEGISVCVPALPGCWSESDTEEEAFLNIQDAIEDRLAALCIIKIDGMVSKYEKLK
jgi:predicted RNase H-like HicB family nuclease